MSDPFKPAKCKFCRKDVMFDRMFGRVYEADKRTLHADNCERRQRFYKNEAAVRAQTKREVRP